MGLGSLVWKDREMKKRQVQSARHKLQENNEKYTDSRESWEFDRKSVKRIGVNSRGDEWKGEEYFRVESDLEYFGRTSCRIGG